MNTINEIKESNTEVNEKLTKEELITRYASIQNINYEEAEAAIGAATEEEILKNIQEKTLEKIRNSQAPMNRAQRRALKKKIGTKKYNQMFANDNDTVEAINETAAKLNYIDLIQKLRKLNEQKEAEENENVNENN